MFIFVLNLFIIMQHIYNYIIKISNELNDTFKTETGLELYGHKDFNIDRLSNRYATIIGHPLLFDGKILDEGTKVLIDPSVYYHSTHGDDDTKSYTTNTIDIKNGIYAIEPQNIIAYKQNDTWVGYLDNFIGKCVIEKTDDKVLGSIIIETGKNIKTNKYYVISSNEFLEDNDVKVGDVLYMQPNYGVSLWLDGKEHTWLRGTDVLAKLN